MVELIVAVSASSRPSFESQFDERTAGLWRDTVELRELYEAREDKETNNGDLQHLARRTNAKIIAASDLTSEWLEKEFDVKRLTNAEIKTYVNEWFAHRSLAWRDNVDKCRSSGGYRWLDIKQWRDQFKRVDSVRGLRVASAILAQLRIVRVGELAEWFDNLPDVDHNAFFIGSDPHSGDFGIITTLSTRIPGPKLHEASALPMLEKSARLRLFSDGGWTGGESVRRLECLFTPCDKKANAVGADNTVLMRFAYITDVAERRLNKKLDEMAAASGSYPKVHISSPPANRLLVNGEHGTETGLAFQSASIRKFVDPANSAAMRELCKKIGDQLWAKYPLGTSNIASTIAFEHSLPKAMLPVLIMTGEVLAEDDSTFTWQPLLASRHVSHPAGDTAGYHCDICPLVE